MAVLFEYHNETWVDNPKALKEYLHSVWKEHYHSLLAELNEETSLEDDIKINREYQPFLSFDGNIARAKNFVGFIQTDNLHLEIYPKVFKNQNTSPILMLKHLFFWFDYCRKWKFPFTKSKLDELEIFELPELIIYLMASKMLDTVSVLPISLYQSVEESLYTPKGRISFNKYLSTGFINGNQHIIDCDYEPFTFDNKLNRIIKYTSRLLLTKTKFLENQKLLQEVIFILDEVDDQHFSYHDLETIVLNPLFSDYADIKDICKIVLQQLLYGNQQYDLTQWSLLFPMEYIFEDFVAGFLESKFSSKWIVEYQKSNMNLSSKPEAFQMKHDIFLTSKNGKKNKVIIDTKYKLRESNFKQDKKKAISQADMYQMVSYATRRGCKHVLLLYPNIDEDLHEPDDFVIESGFPNGNDILITAAEIPFWSSENFEFLSMNLQTTLQKLLSKYEYE